MLSVPQFLLESSICLLVFYLFYYFVLRKETFFQLNRFFLLGSPLLAIAIPLLHIPLRPPSASVVSGLDSYLYPVVSNVQQINGLLWQQVEVSQAAFSIRIADVLLAIYLVGMLVMGIRLLVGLARLFRVIRSHKQQKSEGCTMVHTPHDFPAASFFSYVFWNEHEIKDEKRLIFEHERVHIRQWHSADVLLMELWVILKWYNPLIYLYRKALQVTHEYIADRYVAHQAPSVSQYAHLLVQTAQQHRGAVLLSPFSALIKQRLRMLGQQRSKWYKVYKYVWSSLLFVGMMLLFSFDLIEEIPYKPITESLSHLENYMENIGNQTVLNIQKPKPYAHYLEWGGVEIPLAQKESDGSLFFETRAIAPDAFRQIRQQVFEVRQLYETKSIAAFSMLVETESGKQYAFDNDLYGFYTHTEELLEDYSVFIKILTQDQSVFYAVVAVSAQPVLYHYAARAGRFFGNLTELRFSVPADDCVVRLKDLDQRGGQPYYLEWNNRRFQAIKSGNPLHEPMDIQALSFEDFHQLQKKNFSLVYRNSCVPIDSVFTVINTKDGVQYYCKDQFSEAACYRQFLPDIRTPSTIYLVLKTSLGELFSSIIAVGDAPTIHLQDEAFYSEMLTYTHFPQTPQFVAFSEAPTYQLLWGGLQVDFSYNQADAQTTVALTKKEFLQLLKHEPVLRLANKTLFEDVYFDIRTKDEAIRGNVASHTAAPDAYFKNKTIRQLPKHIKAGNTVYLENIHFDHVFPHRFHLKIQIKDAPKPQTIHHVGNRYQFHWGMLDVDLEKDSKQTYQAEATISIVDFLKSIEQAPVLTSRRSGVLDAFSFVMRWKQERFTIKSALNDPDVYLQSWNTTDFVEQAAAGDTILIEKIQGTGIKGQFRLQLLLDSPSPENLKSQAYQERMVLDWGGVAFDLRQLNVAAEQATHTPILTVEPTLLRQIVCENPELYYLGKRLHIKQAAVLVKESDMYEHCTIEHWEHRDCLLHLLEHVCEESRVSLFLKTKEQKNFLLQLRVSAGVEEEAIQFGRDTTAQFQTFLQDYTKNTYRPATSAPTSQQNTWRSPLAGKGTSLRLYWGDTPINMDQSLQNVGKRTLKTVSLDSLERLLHQEVRIVLDDAPYPLSEVHLFGSHPKTKSWERYTFGCTDGVCSLSEKQRKAVAAHIRQTGVILMSASVLDAQGVHTPIGNVYFEFSDSASDWDPIVKPPKPITDPQQYPFQMVQRPNRHTIVRMDTTSKKYAWMVESYMENPAVELMHIDGFRTRQRVIDAQDALLDKGKVKKVEVLSKTVLRPFEYADMDVSNNDLALYWRGFRASTYQSDFYCMEDFKQAEHCLEFWKGGTSYPIVQFDVHFIDEKGDAATYISQRIDEREIQRAIKRAKERSIVVFDEMLIQTDRAIERVPIRFLYYLE